MTHQLQKTPNELAKVGIVVNMDGRRRSAFELLRQPDIGWEGVCRVWPELAQTAPTLREQMEIDTIYAGYSHRQAEDVEAFRREEGLILPADFDYAALGSLSTEIRLKLEQIRPATLGAAARIPGVTPAAIVSLLRFVKRKNREGKAA